jgi:hypothetical protein
MLRRTVVAMGLALSVMVASVIPASAQGTTTLTVTVTADCQSNSTYTVTVSGTSIASATVTVDYSFKILYKGLEYTVSGQVHTNTVGEVGVFNETIEGIQLPITTDDDVVFIPGTATLTVNGVTDTGFVVEVPSPLHCGGVTPPGKMLEIGPSSMEGHLQIRAGDWISGGYSFKFVSGSHPASTVTVTSSLRIAFTCPKGGGPGGEILVNLGTHSYTVPARNTDWQPTGDANSVLSWAGAGQAPNGCGGNIMDSSKGAIWDATISQSPDNGSLLNWRFKFRDPNAKGKGNVNCLDVTDPRRNKADVCGASWSETVRDP